MLKALLADFTPTFPFITTNSTGAAKLIAFCTVKGIHWRIATFHTDERHLIISFDISPRNDIMDLIVQGAFRPHARQEPPTYSCILLQLGRLILIVGLASIIMLILCSASINVIGAKCLFY